MKEWLRPKAIAILMLAFLAGMAFCSGIMKGRFINVCQNTLRHGKPPDPENDEVLRYCGAQSDWIFLGTPPSKGRLDWFTRCRWFGGCL